MMVHTKVGTNKTSISLKTKDGRKDGYSTKINAAQAIAR